MARPIYSTRFFQISGLTGTHPYTVPAGFVAVVRDLDAFADPTISGSDLFFQGVATQTIWWNNFPVDQRSYGSFRGRQVFNPGETWFVTVDGDPVDVTVSGYLLTTP
jgi:hypothetical protein